MKTKVTASFDEASPFIPNITHVQVITKAPNSQAFKGVVRNVTTLGVYVQDTDKAWAKGPQQGEWFAFSCNSITSIAAPKEEVKSDNNN